MDLIFKRQQNRTEHENLYKNYTKTVSVVTKNLGEGNLLIACSTTAG
jgi:hypothetical protein